MSWLSSHPEKHCTFCKSINKAVLRWRATSSHPCSDFTGSNSQQNFWNVVGAAYLPNYVGENGLALDWTFLMLAKLILQQIYSSAFVLVTNVQKLVITAMQNGSLRPIPGSGYLKLTSLQISWGTSPDSSTLWHGSLDCLLGGLRRLFFTNAEPSLEVFSINFFRRLVYFLSLIIIIFNNNNNNVS